MDFKTTNIIDIFVKYPHWIRIVVRSIPCFYSLSTLWWNFSFLRNCSTASTIGQYLCDQMPLIYFHQRVGVQKPSVWPYWPPPRKIQISIFDHCSLKRIYSIHSKNVFIYLFYICLLYLNVCFDVLGHRFDLQVANETFSRQVSSASHLEKKPPVRFINYTSCGLK